MDRAIKFRFWRDNKMQIAHTLNAYDNNNFSGDGEILMQFTGLLDCEGKEIWEGDLLSNNFGTDKEVIRRIVFQNGSWIMKRIKGNSRLKEDILLEEYHLLNFKVIGNLYENPNLLNNE